MSFDAVVVGAGPAGSAAALQMARRGMSVLLVERGERPGTKNVFGGRMYSWALEKLVPGFRGEAPLEREVTREVLGFLWRDSWVEFQVGRGERAAGQGYTLLRPRFDSWLAEVAEGEGVTLVSGIRVDAPVVEGGRVTGIAAGPDRIAAPVTILAEGALGLLAEAAGLRPPTRARDFAVGVKEVLELPEEKIEDRFGLSSGEGSAQLYLGDFTGGIPGGGFVYTNRDTISVGVTLRLGAYSAGEARARTWEVLERFKSHPRIASYLRGGRLVEYSAHSLPETQYGRVRAAGPGVAAVGDAAGLAANLGITVRGMDFALESGRLAAEAAASGDLLSYPRALREGPVGRTFERFGAAARFMENPRLYSSYPRVIVAAASRSFDVREEVRGEGLIGIARSELGAAGVSTVRALLDVLAAARSM